MGQGGNKAANAFTADKGGNRAAYLAAFTPEGEYLGETEVYADKHAVFAWLLKLLADHPKYAHASAAEKEIERRGRAAGAKVADRDALARLYEALGRRDDALEILTSLPADAERDRARLRILRAGRQWTSLAETLAEIEKRPGRDLRALRDDLLAERGYLLVHEGRHAEARDLLRKRVRDLAASPRASDVHFALGVACWFTDEKDWARFHWMWIWHERREERLAMRAKIAAAAGTMPYANPELGGYESRGMIGTGHIEREHRDSCALYAALKPFYEKGDWKGPGK